MKKNHEEPLVFKMLIPQHTAPSLRIDHQIAIRVETEMCSRIGSWFKATSTICTGPTLPNDMGPDGLTLVISLVKCQISMPPQQGTTFRAWKVKDLGTTVLQYMVHYGTMTCRGLIIIEWYFISQGTKPRDSPSKSGSTKMIRCSNKSTV